MRFGGAAGTLVAASAVQARRVAMPPMAVRRRKPPAHLNPTTRRCRRLTQERRVGYPCRTIRTGLPRRDDLPHGHEELDVPAVRARPHLELLPVLEHVWQEERAAFVQVLLTEEDQRRVAARASGVLRRLELLVLALCVHPSGRTGRRGATLPAGTSRWAVMEAAISEERIDESPSARCEGADATPVSLKQSTPHPAAGTSRRALRAGSYADI